jgi:hypothetical protein
MGSTLHQPVYLRGEKVLVFTQTDVEGLAAPPQSEEDLSRLKIAFHGNGVRSLKIAQGQTKMIMQIASAAQVFLDLKSDDLVSVVTR